MIANVSQVKYCHSPLVIGRYHMASFAKTLQVVVTNFDFAIVVKVDLFVGMCPVVQIQ